MEEKDKTYKPADAAAVEQKAKSMDRKELEDYYVVDKHKRHVPAWGVVLLIIMGVVVVGLIFSMGTAVAQDRINDGLNDVGETFADEVCPMLGDYEFTLQEKVRNRFAYIPDIKVKCVE